MQRNSKTVDRRSTKKAESPEAKPSLPRDVLSAAGVQDSGASLELLKNIISFMKLKQGLSLSDLVSLYNESGPAEDLIPLSVFSHNLSPSESLCKYLKENRGLNYHEIAVLINRDDRSVWTSYQRAIKKSKDLFVIDVSSDMMIPVSVVSGRDKSILESVVSYLSTVHKLSNKRISALLNKNPASIATVHNRARAKDSAAAEGGSS
jgi:hypothetical protein